MGLFLSVCGTMQVRPGLAEEAAQYLRSEGGWPFNEDCVVVIEDDDTIRIDLGDSMSYSTAGFVEKALQGVAERFGVGATVLEAEADGERWQLVVGGTEQERRSALASYLDEQIRQLANRRDRVLDGREVV